MKHNRADSLRVHGRMLTRVTIARAPCQKKIQLIHNNITVTIIIIKVDKHLFKFYWRQSCRAAHWCTSTRTQTTNAQTRCEPVRVCERVCASI